MALTRQKQFTRTEVFEVFVSMYDKKLIRWTLQSDCLPEDWDMTAYIDGPLTFVTLTHPTGQTFTGWAKFDYEGRWVEKVGLYKAMQRAIDKYIDALFEDWKYDLKTAFNEAMDAIDEAEATLNEGEDTEPEARANEVPADKSTVGSS